MLGVIYGLYCVCEKCGESEIRYVGQTVDFARRFDRHLRDAPTHSLPLGRWIIKHGRDNIRHKILAEVKTDSLNESEVYWIAELNTFLKTNPRGLNCTTGGDSGHIGIERPEDVRSKIAATLTGRTRDPAIAIKTRKTRHDREHKDGPPARTKCIYCYPDGPPDNSKRIGAHNSSHVPKGYWIESCPDCDEDFREGKPSKKEYQSKLTGPKVRFGNSLATHNRWHINRGVINPECPYCKEILREGKSSGMIHQASRAKAKVPFGVNPGSHIQWHVNRGVVHPDCPHCARNSD